MELQEPAHETEKLKRSFTLSGRNNKTVRYLQVCEVLLLAPVLLLIIGLLSIPIIMYAVSSTDAEVSATIQCCASCAINLAQKVCWILIC
jgi:uncharacterized membrane protein YiaA